MGTPTDCVYLGVNALMRPRPTSWFPALMPAPTRRRRHLFRHRGRGDGRPSSGVPALAVSLNGYQHYDTAAAVTCTILRALSREPLRTGRILNINVPDLPLDQIKAFA